MPHKLTAWLLNYKGPTKILTSRRDRYHAVTQAYKFGAETHLGGKDTTAFIMQLATIARTLLTSLASRTLMKGPQRV